jgi:hypothetical protein
MADMQRGNTALRVSAIALSFVLQLSEDLFAPANATRLIGYVRFKERNIGNLHQNA